jgi:hypothetical protein
MVLPVTRSSPFNLACPDFVRPGPGVSFIAEDGEVNMCRQV